MEQKSNNIIFLTGFMGSGKTHWGRLWADALNLPFYDLDEAVVKATGKSVARIFEDEGEDYFREREAEELRKLPPGDAGLISCGGGTPCFFENMDWMNSKGLTVYLKTTPAILWARIREEKEVRPLLKNINENEWLYFIEKTLEAREPFYNQSKIVLDATRLKTFTLHTYLNHA